MLTLLPCFVFVALCVEPSPQDIGSGIDPGYSGLWAFDDGGWIAFPGNKGQPLRVAQANDSRGWMFQIADLQLNSLGYYHGSAKHMTDLGTKAHMSTDPRPKHLTLFWGDNDVYGYGISQPKGFYGEADIAYGQPNLQGYIDSLKVTFFTGTDSKLSGTARFVNKISQIPIDGTYADRYAEVTLQGDASGTVGGSLRYVNDVYALRGSRVGMRGSYILLDPRTNAEVGDGFFELRPSKEDLRTLREADGQVGALYVRFVLKAVSGGSEKILKRK